MAYAKRSGDLRGGGGRAAGSPEKVNPFNALQSRAGRLRMRPAVSGTGVRVADSASLVSGVAARYANALMELALDSDSPSAVETDVDRFSALLDESADLTRLVKSPVFSADQQIRAVGAVLERAGIGGLVANIVKVAAANRRLVAVPGIVVAFKELAARHRGEVAAEVTSAEPLSDKHVAALNDALKTALGKDVALVSRVDPALIGGLVVKVGSRMIDGSLRAKLNSLKLAMKEVG